MAALLPSSFAAIGRAADPLTASGRGADTTMALSEPPAGSRLAGGRGGSGIRVAPPGTASAAAPAPAPRDGATRRCTRTGSSAATAAATAVAAVAVAVAVAAGKGPVEVGRTSATTTEPLFARQAIPV
ncbi:hypothetical protein [Actinacidiphila sp. bgisy167]|uniref:hypothetical protein n=1 Tax=Actinacidiphila sp. bgisy167 TaxID=3413797 RepID=UPI003D758B1E